MEKKRIPVRLILWLITLAALIVGALLAMNIAKNFDNPDGFVYIASDDISSITGIATLGIKIVTASIPVSAAMLFICLMWFVFNTACKIHYRRNHKDQW